MCKQGERKGQCFSIAVVGVNKHIWVGMGTENRYDTVNQYRNEEYRIRSKCCDNDILNDIFEANVTSLNLVERYVTQLWT